LTAYNAGQDAAEHGFLSRGALCPLVINEISLPPRAGASIAPHIFSEQVAAYYDNALATMLMPPELIDETKRGSITPYQDPALNDPETAMELAARMWESNMLSTTGACKETVALFTVIKKDEVSASGERVRKTRLVWDERRTNELFRRPPRLPLGSAASFSNWDLAEDSLGKGSTVASFTADLPDWFYRILLPEVLKPYFVFGNFKLSAFVEYMAARGTPIAVPAAHKCLCLAVLPMGWSWAPFVARTRMLDIFERALTPWRSRRVEDGRPTPQPEAEQPVHWGYMDDFGALTVLEEGQALEGAPVAAMEAAAVSAFTELGVVPHKLTLGEGLDSTLGVEMGPDRVLRIVPEKWWMLLAATEWAAEQPVLSVRALKQH